MADELNSELLTLSLSSSPPMVSGKLSEMTSRWMPD